MAFKSLRQTLIIYTGVTLAGNRRRVCALDLRNARASRLRGLSMVKVVSPEFFYQQSTGDFQLAGRSSGRRKLKSHLDGGVLGPFGVPGCGDQVAERQQENGQHDEFSHDFWNPEIESQIPFRRGESSRAT